MIQNKYAQHVDLDNIFITTDIEGNGLAETIVTEVAISETGKVSYSLLQYGSPRAANLSDLELYKNITEYQQGKLAKDNLSSFKVFEILKKLGVTDDVIYEDNDKKQGPVIQLKGFIIADNGVVEAVSSPQSWKFTRGLSIDDSWQHNANFFGKTIYATREAAIGEQTIILKKLNGDIEEK